MLLSCGGGAAAPLAAKAAHPVGEGHVIVLPDDTEVRAADCSAKYDREREMCGDAFAAIDECTADFSGIDRTLCIGAAEQEYASRLGLVEQIELPDGTVVRAATCPEHGDLLLRRTCRNMFQSVSACRREANGAHDTPCERAAINDYDEELRAFDQ